MKGALLLPSKVFHIHLSITAKYIHSHKSSTMTLAIPHHPSPFSAVPSVLVQFSVRLLQILIARHGKPRYWSLKPKELKQHISRSFLLALQISYNDCLRRVFRKRLLKTSRKTSSFIAFLTKLGAYFALMMSTSANSNSTVP